MDFVTKLPRNSSGHDIIWDIVDRLTKSAHFLPMCEDYKIDRLARLYLNEIALGTPLDHEYGLTIPQTDGQSDVLSDFVKFILECSSWNSLGSWGFSSSVVEKYRSPIMWLEIGEGQLIGPELVQETTEKISQIKDRLKAARDRLKSYDERRSPLEFAGPFEIIEKVGLVAYRLDLPEELDEKPMEILEREFKKLKRSRIAIVKVQWNLKRGPEFTWEREDQMKLKYLHLFRDVSS
ncbi:hypothetical protein Tco_0420980 [Tanacetum coccineum]